jgi:hypothetical protein
MTSEIRQKGTQITEGSTNRKAKYQISNNEMNAIVSQ